MRTVKRAKKMNQMNGVRGKRMRYASGATLSKLLAVVVLGYLNCAVDSTDPEDEIDDSFVDLKGDAFGIVEGSPDAVGVLKLANGVPLGVLDDDVGLSSRAAENIVAGRAGPDKLFGTVDDGYRSLAELDRVPYVGKVSFKRLLAFAKIGGYVSSPGSPPAGCVGGCEDAPTDNSFGACAAGIGLPDVRDNLGLGPRVGLGTPMNERDPVWFDQSKLLVQVPGQLRQSGWFVRATAGERFRMGLVFRGMCSEHVELMAYGPINSEQCSAFTKHYVLGGESKIDGKWPHQEWTAPESGVYFVTANAQMYWSNNGTLGTDLDRNAGCRQMYLAWRRVRPDGTLAGQTFEEVADWSLSYSRPHGLFTMTTKGAFASVNGNPVILARAEMRVSPNLYGYVSEPRIMIAPARNPSTPQFLVPCASYKIVGLPIVGDFSGDGRDDLLSGTDLFVSQPDGSFRCQESGFVPELGRPLGAIDLDGDGWLDVVSLNVQVFETLTEVSVLPYYRRGSVFKMGQRRLATVPILAWYNIHRAALKDVNGDGKPEIVVWLRGSTEDGPNREATYAFSLPTPDPSDAAAAPDWLRPLIISPLNIEPSRLPSPLDLGILGPRQADIDGDGIPDLVAAGRVLWSHIGFGVFRGRSDGTFETAFRPRSDGTYEPAPWQYTAIHQGGNEEPTLDISDFDGDGCVDVLVGGSGLTLFRNLRCRTRK